MEWKRTGVAANLENRVLTDVDCHAWRSVAWRMILRQGTVASDRAVGDAMVRVFWGCKAESGEGGAVEPECIFFSCFEAGEAAKGEKGQRAERNNGQLLPADDCVEIHEC